MSTPITVETLSGANGLRITGEFEASNASEVTQHFDERLRDPGDLTVVALHHVALEPPGAAGGAA